GGELADHEPGAHGARRLLVLAVRPDVADLGRGHGHDLPAVRGVGQDLLVAGDRGVEHDLAVGLAVGAERLAAVGRAVLERQERYLSHAKSPPTSWTGRPPRSVSTARPTSGPCKGEFIDWGWLVPRPYDQARSTSIPATSADAPSASVPASRP